MHLLQVKIKAIASFIQYHVTPALWGIFKRPQLHLKWCQTGTLIGREMWRRSNSLGELRFRSIIDSCKHLCLMWGAEVWVEPSWS
jgi:hypothetical protein